MRGGGGDGGGGRALDEGGGGGGGAEVAHPLPPRLAASAPYPRETVPTTSNRFGNRLCTLLQPPIKGGGGVAVRERQIQLRKIAKNSGKIAVP